RELAKFWGGVLGLEPDLREDQDDPRYLHLNGRPDDPKILLQRVDHPSRVHFDIETDDIDAEVMRLEKLGAKIIERVETWVVMEAPSKHRFCVINPIRSDFKDNSNQWE
ncbi:MAG: VOC family protein, partial [Chromatiales bacterium]|nr:VOC family protein [Chromatiales bacterium]